MGLARISGGSPPGEQKDQQDIFISRHYAITFRRGIEFDQGEAILGAPPSAQPFRPRGVLAGEDVGTSLSGSRVLTCPAVVPAKAASGTTFGMRLGAKCLQTLVALRFDAEPTSSTTGRP
jgi:hypothetical protein